MKKVVLAAVLGFSSCGCIARGSEVLTPRGRRRIESLQPGDEVISIDPSTGERVTALVEATRTVKRETFLLQGDNWSLRCTSDHPLYDPRTREWAPAGDWMLEKRSALLLVADEPGRPREVLVTSRTLDAVVTELIDLSIAHELHNFIAEGILVHNKPPIRRTCPTPGSGFTTQREGNPCICTDGASGEISCSSGATRCLDSDSLVDCGSGLDRTTNDAGP